MSDVQAQHSILKQTADPAVADAIARLIGEGEDHELNRINLLDFAARTFTARELVVFRSELLPQGSRHTPISCHALSGNVD